MGCPCSFSHDFAQPQQTRPQIQGKYLVYARLLFNSDTKEIEVNRIFPILKRVLFEGGMVRDLPKHMTTQIYVLDSADDYDHFLTSANFANASEYYKALAPFMLNDYCKSFTEPMQDFLARNNIA